MEDKDYYPDTFDQLVSWISNKKADGLEVHSNDALERREARWSASLEGSEIGSVAVTTNRMIEWFRQDHSVVKKLAGPESRKKFADEL